MNRFLVLLLMGFLGVSVSLAETPRSLEIDDYFDLRYVGSPAVSPDGKWVVSASEDETLRLWNASTGKEMRVLRPRSAATAVRFGPHGKRIVSGSWDDTVKVWDASLEESPMIFEGHTDDVTMVAFSADSKRIASASEDKTVKIWDARTGQVLQSLGSEKDQVTCVAFSPNGKRVVTGGRIALKIWRIENP